MDRQGTELEPRRRGFAMPVRPARGRMVAGVCVALADRWAVDVTLVRLVFVVLALAWGIGVLAYLALWVLMPDASVASAHASFKRTTQRNVRRMPDELRLTGRRLGDAWAQVRPRRLSDGVDRPMISVIVVVVGLVLVLVSLGAFTWLTPLRLLALVAIIAGSVVLLTVSGRSR